MAIARLVILFASTIFVISESSYVAPLRKCNSKDSECLKNYFQSVVWEAAKNGIPEANIPILDPVQIKDYQTSIAYWVDFDFDGVGKGMKSCIVNRFWLNLEKRYASTELICDLSMNGHYKLFTNSSLIRNLLDSDTMYGDGTGSLTFEKIKLAYDFSIKVEQRGGDYFIKPNFEHSKFNFDILRKATFAAERLYLGKYEASDLITTMMNKHWKLVMDGTALEFMYKVKRLLFDGTQKYFNTIPVKNYLTDDVSPYVTA